MSSRRARPTVRALIVCAGVCLTWLVSTPIIGQNAAQGEAPRLDPARELVMKIDAPFTVAAVGDIFGAMAPIVPLEEPRLQSLLKDHPRRRRRLCQRGVVNCRSPPLRRPRWRSAGAESGGGRHEGDGHPPRRPRQQSHRRQQRRRDVFHRCTARRSRDRTRRTGRNLEEARDTAYLMTAKGRVGLVALMPISDNAPGGDNQGPSFARTAATSRSGSMGGAPGLNPAPAHHVSDGHSERVRVVEEDP